MRRTWWPTALIAVALLVLVVGGALVGTGFAAAERARGDLNAVRVANDNLALAIQARVDEARGQASLARTSADDADLAELLDVLVELDPAAEEHVEEVRRLEPRVTGGDSLDERDAFVVLLALARLEDETGDAAAEELDAAGRRFWWSFWTTGAASAVVLVSALVVVARGRRTIRG